MNLTGKLVPAALTAGVLAAGVAFAAPASAISRVTCPTPPTWSHGVEVWTDYGFTACYAGTPGTATLYVSRVYLATADWNNADVYDTYGGDLYLPAGTSFNYVQRLGYEVTVDAVEIDG